jgi:type I restriction enzyme, S subunit
MSAGNGKELPKGWTITPIENLFWPLEDGRTLHQGWSPQCDKAPASTDKDWGVLKTTAIQAGAFLPEHNKQLPAGLTPRPQVEVKPGDILLTCAGPRIRCGVACLVRHTRPRLMMSGKMYRFRVPPDHFDPRFLEAFLLTPKAIAAIDKMKTGGSDSGLNLTHDRFRPLPVPVAPLNEQRRVMDTVDELLSDLDAGVAVLEGVRAKLKQYRAAVLKAAVEGALTEQWRREHSATESAADLLTRILRERRHRWEEAQLRKFKAQAQEPPKNWKTKYQEPAAPNITKLPKLLDGWCWATLDQVSLFVTSGSRGWAEYYTAEGPLFVRSQDIKTDRLVLADVAHVMPPASSEGARTRLRQGDLLVTITGANVAKAALVDCEIEEVYVSQHVGMTRFVESMLGPFIHVYVTASSGGRKLLLEVAYGAGKPGLNLDNLRELHIPIPPLAEQEAIVELVEDQLSIIEHLEAGLDAKLKSAQALRQSILRDAFEGKLVPQDPNDEPAEELLKRIAAEREARLKAARAAKQTDRKRQKPRQLAAKS